MLSPTQMLDCHADLLQRAEGVPQFLRALTNGVNLDMNPSDNPEARESIQTGWAMSFLNAVRTAYTYQVTPDMMQLVEFAAAQLDITDQFDKSLAPTGSGLVRFETPIKVHDVRGKIMLVSWMVWGPIGTQLGPATAFTWLNDSYTDPDEFALTLRNDEDRERAERVSRVSGRWGYSCADLAFQDQRMGPALFSLTPGSESEAKYLAEGLEPQPSTNLTRYVHALWMLLGQTVTTIKEEEPDRAGRRRMARMKLPPRVSVITLRRSENHSERAEGESLIEWQHRWVVRGHWRWQPYGSRAKKHEGEHVLASGSDRHTGSLHSVRFCTYDKCDYREERVWINPYVKGPEDKPFSQSEKLYRLSQ